MGRLSWLGCANHEGETLPYPIESFFFERLEFVERYFLQERFPRIMTNSFVAENMTKFQE